MNVTRYLTIEQALEVYVLHAKREGVLRTDNRVIIERIESQRGGATLRDAARRLGTFSSWPDQRKRQFSRMLSQARAQESSS